MDLCESTEIQITDGSRKGNQISKQFKTLVHLSSWQSDSFLHEGCNAANPSQSLINRICYPEAFNIFSKPTEWGCKHENRARDIYFKLTAQNHRNLRLADSGLVINTNWPFIGASPDGIVSCD